MKRSLIIVLSIFLWTSIATAQQYYTIVVGTFLDAKTTDFNEIKPYGLVYSYQLDGNLSKIYLGGFDKRAKADQVVESLKDKGYTNAFVQERHLNEGKTVVVIQMATRFVDKPIEWEKFEQNGQLYAILNDNKIKVLTGIFPDLTTAKQYLPAIKNSGYSDAFIKKVNSALLVKVSEFETGIKKPLLPISFEDNKLTKGNTDALPPGQKPGDYNTKGKNPVYQPNTPPSYDTRVVTPKSGNPTPVSIDEVEEEPAGMPLPAIRRKVKRRSALELQKVLKNEKYYTSSLDGYYGKGTAAAYSQALLDNTELKKYAFLAQRSSSSAPATSGNRLQNAINSLRTDPSAINIIDASNSPIAKAYRAYYLFSKLGASSDINRLMSGALQGAFSGKKMENKPPFDYNATYAYEDMDQLIRHLFYIHAAPDNIYEVPCWVYKRHPRESAKAQAAIAGFGSEDFKSAACSQQLNWDEIKLLEAIASDLNSNQTSASKLAAGAAKRSQIFLAPNSLTKKERTEAEQWNQELWANLNAWSNRDPLHERSVVALKIAYYQSAVRLEDYFMDQGYSAKDAKSITLVALKTLVGEHLSRFI
jgi:hypothetical protein